MPDLPPPILVEDGSYENWRGEIQMWQITTTMEPKRQALAVRAKLTGKVREAALKLDAADLNNENGMSFLIDALDAIFRKPKKWDTVQQNKEKFTNNNGPKPKKWDVSNNSANENKKENGKVLSGGDSNLSPTEKARQRAAELSSKLAAEGKYQQPKALPEQAIVNPLSSALPNLLSVHGALQNKGPDVLKMENGNSFAEFNINDVCARPFLTRSATRELISQQSGAAISLRGRFLTQEDRRQQVISGAIEKPLVMNIQANVAAKVQVAIHKILEVCRNYEKFGPENNFNNYGLSGAVAHSSHHFVQDKLFIGLEHAHPEFNLKEKLAGVNAANFGFMVQQTGAKVFLRGRGSGYLEPNSGRESFEALHIYVSHPRQDGLDMARQLCESLIETVKTQYQQWSVKRVTLPPNPSMTPQYPVKSAELRYPIYSQNNGFNAATYPTVPSLMSKEVALPINSQDSVLSYSTSQANYSSNLPVATYGSEHSGAPPVSKCRPRFSELTRPDQGFQSSDSHYNTSNSLSGNERYPFHPDDRNVLPNAYEQLIEPDYREGKSDRASRRRERGRSRSPENAGSVNIGQNESPESKKSSRFRDHKVNRGKDSPRRSPNRKESSPPRESPRGRRDSPVNRRELSPGRRDLSPNNRDSFSNRRKLSPDGSNSPVRRRESSPSHRDSPRIRRDSPVNQRDSTSRRDSSPNARRMSPTPRKRSPEYKRELSPKEREVSPDRKEERKKRKFTEEPKKKRKFSEDPRLLEQAKAQIAAVPSREEEMSTLEYLQGKSAQSPKLQFRSKKLTPATPKEEDQRKPKSILKMAPPPVLPVIPKRPNGIAKSVKISPAGLAAKKKTSFKDDKFMPPPPMEKLRAPSPPQVPPKALKMGALSSLIAYEDDSDEDD